MVSDDDYEPIYLREPDQCAGAVICHLDPVERQRPGKAASRK